MLALLEALGLDTPGIGHNGGPPMDDEAASHFLVDLLFSSALSAPGLRGRDDLRAYQDFMVDAIKRLPAVLLAAGMGLGKTVSTLTAAADLLAEGAVSRILVVAPLRVAKDTWPDEIVAWLHTQHLSWTLIRAEDDDDDVEAAYKQAYREARDAGESVKDATNAANRYCTVFKDEKRRRLASENTQIHIINRENVVWLLNFWGDRWPYDMLVYDEASRLKQGRKRTTPNKRKDGSVGKKNLSEFGALSRVRNRFKKVVELSGTPSPNGLIDLWGPFYILDRGERLGDNKHAFHMRWFHKGVDGYAWVPNEYAHEQITSRISDVMISLKEEDYLDLPELISNPVKVKLPPALMKQYRKFEREMVIDLGEGQIVEAVSAGVLTNKLLQFANGSLYLPKRVDEFDFNTDDVKHLHDLKLDALESIVEEAAGAPILVAYSFKFDLQRIRKRFPKAVIFNEDKDALKKWNAGKIDMLITHPASAGHGLNFQHGGNIGVWYGLTWSLELYQQFMKRLHRSGQKAEEVVMHHIIAEGTADEDVMGAMQVKGATQDSITDVVRVRLGKAK